MILLLDNFDSFTYNLVDYIEQLGEKCLVVRNNVSLNYIRSLNFQSIVLSPGPATPAQAGVMMDVIDYYHQKMSILGICLGHQALGEFFGAKLVKASKPMHGKLSTIEIQKQDAVFEDISNYFDVVRYHSLVLENLPDSLELLAQTQQSREIMIIKHQQLPIYGFQFHPEAILTQFGLKLIDNWLKTYQPAI